MNSSNLSYVDFFRDIYLSKDVLFKLALNDFKVKYAGSYLGIVWAFIHPIITILVYWFVFQIGFKNSPVDDFPFILWLICGVIPWFYFSETLTGATNSLFEYNYLVKKVVFSVNIVPIVKIISGLFVHLFFILFILFMFLIYGYGVDIYAFQLIYYVFSMIMLLLGVTWITSALSVFARDMSQAISVILQFGFWLTPIFWSYEMVPEKWQVFFKLNPLYYIVLGFRDSFINEVWFWERPAIMIQYWCIVLILFVLGVVTFKKLRVHFSDML